MNNYIHTYIKDLDKKGDVFILLQEIEQTTKLSLSPYIKNSMVIHYLKDYRANGGITKDSLDAIPFSEDMRLRKKIKKIHETEIWWLCQDIAKLNNSGVEKSEGHTLYVFLNRHLKDKKKKKKKINL